MSILDIFIAVPILFGAYLGYRKGIVIEICTLAALVSGVYAGVKGSALVSGWINGFMEQPSEYVPLVSFSVCFIGVVVVVFFIGKWLERFVKLTLLKPIDRLLGAVFGLTKFVVIMGVALTAFKIHPPLQNVFTEEQKESSLLYNPLTHLVSEYIPLVNTGEWINKI